MFPKTLRYLLVEVRGGRAEIEQLGQDVSTYPVRWTGGFTCPENPALGRVWQIGAHTVQLCMEDVYMDTPRRERAGWLGDMVPEALAAYCAFGETKVARHSLDLYMRSQHEEGWIVGRYPSIDGPNMPTWSASYAFALADYVRYSGDAAFAEAVWPGVQRLTAWFEGQRRQDDLLVVTPTKRSDNGPGRYGYVLVDWAPTRLDGAVTAMNMFYYRYLAECAYLAWLLDRQEDIEQYASLAARTKQAIQSEMFDEERGFFVNCRDEKGLSRRAGYQENLLALLWQIATSDQEKRIVETLLPDDAPLPVWTTSDRNWVTLSSGTEPWRDDEIVPVGSPFFMYYALGALFEIGRTEAALNSIEAHYGGLLSRGETTVWEDWSGDTSRSHGWGAAPTIFAAKYVLGAEPIAPGWRVFRVAPSFGSLKKASGRVPTPHGTVGVSWQRDGEGVTLDVVVPDGTQAEVGLPSEDSDASLLYEGQECPSAPCELRRRRYLLCRVGPGTHRFGLR